MCCDLESTEFAATAPPVVQIGVARRAIPVQGCDFDADRYFAVVVPGCEIPERKLCLAMFSN